MTFVRSSAAYAVRLLLIFAPNAGAQATDPASTRAGTLSVRADQQVGMAITAPAQRRAAFAAADAIVALLRSDVAVAAPIGYSVVLTRVAGMTKVTPDERPMTGRPASGVRGSLNYFAMEDDGHGGRRIGEQGGSVSFSVIVNAPGQYTDAEELGAEPDHGPSVLSDVRKTGEFRGHPIYNGECVAVYGGSAPPFVPLTMERYFRLVMLDYRADSVRHAAQRAEMQSQAHHAGPATRDDSALAAIMNQGVAGEGQRIAELKARLDALTPTERQKPVAVSMHQVSWNYQADDLADVSDTASAPLVQLNPAFFDNKRPETAAQIVTVCIPGLQGLENMSYDRLAGPERDDEKRMLEQRTRDAVRIRDHLDWAALEALVKP